MISEKYYDGFENEVEVVIYYYDSNNNKLGIKIWEGYFENLLSGCFNGNANTGGLMESYITHEGFYDEKPWEIKNIQTAIYELERFDEGNVETENINIINIVKQIRGDLISLMKEALKNNISIYIEYD